jgi:DNA-binding MarR family transcriptional regulator
LVRRDVDPTDRRKWFIVLTDKGDKASRAARHTHNAVLRRNVTRVEEKRSLPSSPPQLPLLS